MYITATVSFVGLTHHLKLMGLRPHYFKAFPFYKSPSVYCTSPLWHQAEDQYMDGVKTSCIEKSPRLQLPGSARWAFLPDCFQHTYSRLCGTLSKIPRLCRFICPISGFIWSGVDFLPIILKWLYGAYTLPGWKYSKPCLCTGTWQACGKAQCTFDSFAAGSTFWRFSQKQQILNPKMPVAVP